MGLSKKLHSLNAMYHRPLKELATAFDAGSVQQLCVPQRKSADRSRRFFNSLCVKYADGR
jgi:hypothetical protein